MAALKTQKNSILNEIYRLELRYEKEVIKLRGVQAQLDKQKKTIAVLETEKRGILEKISETKQRLKKTLRILYKSKDQPSFLFLMRINSFNQLYQYYYCFKKIFEYKISQLSKINVQMSGLNLVSAKIQKEQEQLLLIKASIENSIGQIENNKKEHLVLMEKVNNDFDHFSQLLDELKTQSNKIDQVISDQPHYQRIESVNSLALKGKMPKPIKGKYLNRFGKIKSSKFNTYVYNNGIKIRPDGSDIVSSVFSGIVVFSNYFKGYGNLMIVRHSKDLYTLYGYCKEFKKTTGDWVQQGEAIAVAGDTGSTVGKALYFEVRVGTTSENPLLWFSRR